MRLELSALESSSLACTFETRSVRGDAGFHGESEDRRGSRFAIEMC